MSRMQVPCKLLPSVQSWIVHAYLSLATVFTCTMPIRIWQLKTVPWTQCLLELDDEASALALLT